MSSSPSAASGFINAAEALGRCALSRESGLCGRWADDLLSQKIFSTSGIPVVTESGSLNASYSLHQVIHPQCQASAE